MRVSKLFISVWSSNDPMFLSWGVFVVDMLLKVSHHLISRRLPLFPEVSEREAETGNETEKERDCGSGSRIKGARLKRMRRKKEWWTRWATEKKATTRRTTGATASHLVTCPERTRQSCSTFSQCFFCISEPTFLRERWHFCCLVKTLSV